jgi:formylglycine-generating enzyme required for sulfatase activity
LTWRPRGYEIGLGTRGEGSDRVNRGGSFDNDADDLRASNRDDDDDPSDDDDDIGARCCSSGNGQMDGLHGRRPSA